MSNNVVSIFKYVPRDMGQCPKCRGYIVQLNFDWFIADKNPDEPKYREIAIKNEGTDWHCLECGCRW
jgi:ssDNA-binding Zn-finger/Zn-ribbon topoisomerase 1